MLSFARRERPAAVLDLGCGYDAGLLRQLAPHVTRLVGVDLRVSAAAKALPGSLFLEQRIDEALAALDEGAFDLVTMMSVLEHLEDGPATLAGCHRVLRPGGTLIVHVPTWQGKPVLEWFAFRRGVATEGINDHRMYYGVRDLWPPLIAAGFEPRNVRMRYHTGGFALRAVARRAA